MKEHYRETFVNARECSLLLDGPLEVGIEWIFRPGRGLLLLLVLRAFFGVLGMTWFGWLVGGILFLATWVWMFYSIVGPPPCGSVTVP